MRASIEQLLISSDGIAPRDLLLDDGLKCVQWQTVGKGLRIDVDLLLLLKLYAADCTVVRFSIPKNRKLLIYKSYRTIK